MWAENGRTFLNYKRIIFSNFLKITHELNLIPSDGKTIYIYFFYRSKTRS